MESGTDDTEETTLRYDLQKPICRVCFSTEKQMKSAVEVQKYFMALTNINVLQNDGMPQWVCIECAARMKKGVEIKAKMLHSFEVLHGLLMSSSVGRIDPTSPEVAKHKAPLLGSTEILVFDSLQERLGYHSILQLRKRTSNAESSVPDFPLFETQTAFESVETAFSDFEDPLESYKYTNSDKELEAEKEYTSEENEDVEDEEDLEEEEESEEESSEDSDAKSEPVKREKVKSVKVLPVTKIVKSSIQEPIDVSWTSDSDFTLIEFVRQNPALYNPRHELYKVAVLKQKLWRDAGDLLDKTDSECYKRWCYVRDYYIRRRGKSRCGEAARKRAQLLSFLDHVPSPQRSWVAPLSEQGGEEIQETEDREEVKMESTATATAEFDPWEGIRIGDQHSKNGPWDSEADDALIELVRRRPVLYNTRCKDYRKVRLKQALWQEVAEKLNKTESACYKRWCYVRDYYVRRKSNPGALSSGPSAKRRAHRLAFLDQQQRTYTPKPAKASTESSTEGTNSSSLPGFTALRYRLGGYSKRSSEASWTPDHDDILIEFVAAHAALYNPRSKHFRCARLKQGLWARVAETLKRTDTDCCRRWCYIRDYYVRRRGKPGVLSTGKAARRRAQRLAFLDALGKEKLDVKSDDEALNVSEQTNTECTTPEYRISERSTEISWTSESDALLINFVRHNEALYNPKNRNAQLKMKLWSDIASMLDKTDSDCYKRWCYVRDYYTRRRGKGRGGEAAKRRAQLLSFLDSVSATQRGK